MASIININFASVFTVENMESISESDLPSRGIELLKIGAVREQDVHWYLDKLDTDKLTGPDKLFLRQPKELKQQDHYKHLEPIRTPE